MRFRQNLSDAQANKDWLYVEVKQLYSYDFENAIEDLFIAWWMVIELRPW